jgi:DNA replication protein DnaC
MCPSYGLPGGPVLFVNADVLLVELTSLNNSSAMSQRLRHHAGIELLCIDEIGYLTYSSSYADERKL